MPQTVHVYPNNDLIAGSFVIGGTAAVVTAIHVTQPQPTREERYIAALKDRGLPLKDGVDPEKAKEAALMACDMISADIPQWVIAEQMTEQTELDASQALAFLSVTRSFYCPEKGSS